MPYLTKNQDGSLRHFMIIFTGIKSTGSLALPEAYSVFNLFTEKAQNASLASNHFPVAFINVMEAVYNRGFERRKDRRTTYILGISFVSNSLNDLGQHLILAANRFHDKGMEEKTHYLYLIACYDLVANFQNTPEAKLLAGFFPNNELPKLKDIAKERSAFEIKNTEVISQRMANSFVIKPIQHSIINARYSLDDPSFDIVEGEIEKRRNQKRVISENFYDDPKVPEEIKHLVERKETDLFLKTLNSQPNSENQDAMLTAINTIIDKFDQLVQEASKEVVANNEELIRICQEKKMEDQDDDVTDSKTDESEAYKNLNKNSVEYIEQLSSAKAELKSAINLRILKRPNENANPVVNARLALKTGDLLKIQRALSSLRKSIGKISSNDKKNREIKDPNDEGSEAQNREREEREREREEREREREEREREREEREREERKIEERERKEREIEAERARKESEGAERAREESEGAERAREESEGAENPKDEKRSRGDPGNDKPKKNSSEETSLIGNDLTELTLDSFKNYDFENKFKQNKNWYKNEENLLILDAYINYLLITRRDVYGKNKPKDKYLPDKLKTKEKSGIKVNEKQKLITSIFFSLNQLEKKYKK